ncbi:DUF3368 domain-containing protein [Neolewinella sp.]|uniref:DUF3368 domain-containing protein n=1 Tax=Neolewinella sp. TaxID=2993543 RepID=UPI003B522040
MIVVSDTSVITNLAQIEYLDLLKNLYRRIVIPTHVSDELMHHAGTMNLVKECSWIEAVVPTDKKLYEKLLTTLDPGEAAAIVLSKELSADLLLIDERKGRRVAKDNGIRIVGLLGVLIDGKQRGTLPDIKPIMDRLIYETGFRVSSGLYQRVLREVDE